MASTLDQLSAEPRYKLPTSAVGGKLPASFVKSGIDQLLEADIKPQYNLGTFVSTDLDSTGEQLLLENYARNLACQNEYAGVKEIQNRCISILGTLWGAPIDDTPVGSATPGSSEAIYLGILAMKRRWQAGRTDQALSNQPTPNIITGSHAHVAVMNGASASDIEIRTVDITAKSNYSFDPLEMEGLIDDGTIGVVLVLGNTFTGHFDPIEETSMILDKHEQLTGRNIPIHVDAASGGFVAPFNGEKGPRWDFSIPRVVSINTSGHKFGLTAAAIGWVLWRNDAFLPSSMVHHSAYLSGQNKLPTIRYSQASYGVMIQYYYLASLGRQGFEEVVQSSLQRAAALSKTLEETGIFFCVNKTHQSATGTLPVVAFGVRPEIREQNPDLDEECISSSLIEDGYSVPCCKLPVRGEETQVLRIVVRPSLKQSILDSFIARLLRLVDSKISRQTMTTPPLN